MPFLLDTNVLSAYLLRRSGAVALIDPLVQRQEAETSILIYGEVTEYLRGFPNAGLLQVQLRRLMLNIPPRSLTYAAVERYADLRRILRPQGQLIGGIDTLVAATAIERNLVLFTTDSDFMRVPGLQYQLIARVALR
jgi:predicted nucleic acid-binding protein